MHDFLADIRRMKTVPGYRGMIWWMLDQSFWVIITFRALNQLNKTPLAPLARLLEKAAEFLFKTYIPSPTQIGGGLVIFHAFGIIINGKCTIGNDCTLYARVCLGNRWPGDGAPTIGNHVTIGTGACIFGPVSIPDNAIVKANAVVTPSDTRAVIIR
jgi:serine O-acetyltransferase